MIKSVQIQRWMTAPPVEGLESLYSNLNELTTRVDGLQKTMAELKSYCESKNATNDAAMDKTGQELHDLSSALQQTRDKITELERPPPTPTIERSKKLSRLPVRIPPALTEVEGPRSYHAPTAASQEKSKNAVYLNAEGMIVKAEDL